VRKTERHPDRQAAERERKRRKARYGMRVVGRGTRLLGRLSLKRGLPKGSRKSRR
jgi:hypothetical protein